MKTIKCPVCGEVALALRTGPGRFVTHRRMEVEVPEDFALPECAHCGARPINLRTAEKLDPLLEAGYHKRLTELVNADLDRLSRTRPLYEWEQILGYSKGWLSKIREAKAPSPQAVALIRLVANAPDRVKELSDLWARPRTTVLTSTASTVAPQPTAELTAQLGTMTLFSGSTHETKDAPRSELRVENGARVGEREELELRIAA